VESQRAAPFLYYLPPCTGGLVYVRDEDYRRSEERSFVKICKRDGAYHKEQQNKPCRLLHKDNVRQITVLESAPWT
jgi:hypothetical protein